MIETIKGDSRWKWNEIVNLLNSRARSLPE